MSHPIRWHFVALVGKRVALAVAVFVTLIGLTLESTASATEIVDAADRAADNLEKASEERLRAYITIGALITAMFFGWLDKSSLQVIQADIRELKNRKHTCYKCGKPILTEGE